MAELTFRGETVRTNGSLPKIGERLKDFALVTIDLQEVNLETYGGKKKVLNIFPSIDTSVCSKSVVDFNRAASDMLNTVVLNISHDLPFALARFCGAQNIRNSVALSAFRSSFAKDYGIEFIDGPLNGLISRVVIVADASNKIVYCEQVKEISDSVNLEAAMEQLKILH